LFDTGKLCAERPKRESLCQRSGFECGLEHFDGEQSSSANRFGTLDYKHAQNKLHLKHPKWIPA